MHLSILVSEDSRFSLQFSTAPGFDDEGLRTVVLRRQGDYVAWGPGLFHRWHCDTRCTILTLRWTPAGEA
jgi:hypothetical protein